MTSRVKILSLASLLLCCSIVVFQSVRADSDEYDLGIEEDTEITWEFTKVNEEMLEELFELYEVEYEAIYFDYKEGDELKYKLTSYDEEDDYYRLYFNVYENDELEGYTTHKVAKDPDDLSADWYAVAGQTNIEYGDTYDLAIILTDTRDYLKEFDESIPSWDHERVYATSKSIVINNTDVNREDVAIFEYDEDGILEVFTLIYKNIIILEIELDDVSKSEFNLFFLILIVVIISSVVIVLVVAILLIIRQGKKVPVKVKAVELKKEIVPFQAPIESIPATIADNSVMGVEEIIFCELCGAKKEVDAIFCTNCGNKF